MKIVGLFISIVIFLKATLYFKVKENYIEGISIETNNSLFILYDRNDTNISNDLNITIIPPIDINMTIKNLSIYKNKDERIALSNKIIQYVSEKNITIDTKRLLQEAKENRINKQALQELLNFIIKKEQ